MDNMSSIQDEHWEDLQERLNLLFSKMGTMETSQQQMKTQMDINSQVLDQAVRDQLLMSKQLAETGRVVAQLTLQQMRQQDPEDGYDSERSRDSQRRRRGRQRQDGQAVEKGTSRQNRPNFCQPGGNPTSRNTTSLPKMSFPRFDGSNPKIWKDKAVDYFTIFNIPRVSWVVYATMNFDDNAAKWLQAYKMTHDLGDWDHFTAAVEENFGTYDYKKAMTALMSLKQTGSVQEYYQDFVDARYQLAMHNCALDELFFVNYFVRGLKQEVKASVQAQDPSKVDQALHLATIQEEVLARAKFQPFRRQINGKALQQPDKDQKNSVQGT
ncbi:unnamed protein product [Urochloa humidicola]